MKLRAERRLGEILRKMEREKPGEYKKLHDETFYPKPGLDDLGITKIQSQRWQRLNEIPEEHQLSTRELRAKIKGAEDLLRVVLSKSWVT